MKKRLVDADKLMERAKMNSVLVTVEHDHHDYGLTLGTLNKIVKECELPSAQPEKRTEERTEKHACDLIDRQAALKALKKNRFPGAHYIDTGVKIALREIKALPSAQPYTDEEIQKMQDIEQAQLDKAYEMGKADALRWIPCSERLPSKADHTDDMVLVCYRNGSVRFNTYMNGWVQGNPVAWMPLPEPYREVE